MKSKYIKNLLGALALVSLAACSGSGSCPPGANSGGSTGGVTLKLTAPNQYPAGLPTPTIAYVTMTNTSGVSANNLFYQIPDNTNYTQVAVTVVNGSANPCLSIAAHQSCTFPVTIGANSYPGSFIVTATPDAYNISNVAKLKNLFAQNSSTLQASIGLVDAPVNNESGADGITFFYDKNIQGTAGEDTYISIVAYVNSLNAGSFNNINLIDSSGNKLDYTVVSGNTGGTNLVAPALVTLLVKVPAGVPSLAFYAQTAENSNPVSTSDKAHNVSITDTPIGILSISPNLVNFTSTYKQATFTIFNNGLGAAKNIRISGVSSPLVGSTSCGSSLETNSSCSYVVNNSSTDSSGTQTLTVTYNNGQEDKTILAQIEYTSESALYGISLTSADTPSFEFVANTLTTSESSVVKITNTGGFAEKDFALSLPQYFTVSNYSGANSCVISNNTISTILNATGDYCYFVLTYTNPSVTATSSALLSVNYKYSGDKTAPQVNKTLTYTTNLVSASLTVAPTATLASPYSYASIVSNSGESETQVFVVTNNGQDTAATLSYGVMTGDTSYFTRILSSVDDCSTKSSLPVGGTCNVTIKFGPNSTSKQNATVTLPISYVSAGSGIANNAHIVVKGTVRQPLAANIIISSIVSSNAVAGNGESSVSAFQMESTTATVGAITLTYVNTADSDANQFVIDYTKIPAGYTVNNDQSTCGNTITQLQRNSGNSCVVVLNSTVVSTGNNDIDLTGNLLASWQDEESTKTEQQVSWLVNGSLQSTVYVTIFASPVIVVTSNPSPVGTVNQGNTFDIIATLQGGYNVSAQSLAVTGLSSSLFSIAPASCVIQSVSPQSLICTFTVTVLTPDVNSYVATVTNSGVVPVVPATVAFNANQPAKSVSIALESASIDVGMTRAVTATLSEVASGSPVTVTFTSGTSGVASVQSSCSVSVGQTQCQVGVYGVAAGTSSISASADGGYGSAPAQTITVTLVPSLVISVGSTLLQGDAAPDFSTSVTVVAYPAVTSNTIVTFALTPVTPGGQGGNPVAFDGEDSVHSKTCTIPTGQNSCTIAAASNQSQLGLQHVSGRTGSRTLQASASGYGASNQIDIQGANTVTPTLTLSLAINPVYISAGTSTTTVATTATLSAPAPAGGVTVNFTTPTAGWVGYYTSTLGNTASCTVPSGLTSCSVDITPLYFGSFTVNATASGYSTNNQKILYIQTNP